MYKVRYQTKFWGDDWSPTRTAIVNTTVLEDALGTIQDDQTGGSDEIRFISAVPHPMAILEPTTGFKIRKVQ